MKRFFLISAFVFFASSLYAQQAKLYLNKQEIALPSVHFLDAATIDSVNFFTGLEANRKFNLQTLGVDSVFVIFKKNMSDVVTYYQLLDLYHMEKKARTLPLNLGSVRYEYVVNADLMMFNPSVVPGISVEMAYATHVDYIRLGFGYRRPYNSEAGKMITWLQGYVEGNGDNFYYRKFKKQ
jgi:hypothetical protein